jgi:hypothetical protein
MSEIDHKTAKKSGWPVPTSTLRGVMLSLRSIGKTAPPLTSHLRLVVKIANGHRGYGLPISDVTAEGNVGLMQALERFEPEKGFRLAICRMVDQGSNPGIHLALLVAGEDRHRD